MSFRTFALVAITSTLLSSASIALAEDTPAAGPPVAVGTITESSAVVIDTVHTRGGATLQGHVSEIVVGDHVTVVLGNGEAHRVVWADVDRVIVAAPLQPASAEAGPRARVHIKAPHPAYLYRRAAGTTDFVTACQAPCDLEMPLGDTYKIGGHGFKTTAEFALDAAPGGQVDLTVDGPSWTGIVGGGSLVLLGGITAYVGTLFALESCDRGRQGCRELHNGGLGAMAIGGLALGLGLAIVYPSLKTGLSQQKDRPSNDAFLRSPTWRSASAEGEGNGVPTMFPLAYGGRF